jgi:hypothetical protein
MANWMTPNERDLYRIYQTWRNSPSQPISQVIRQLGSTVSPENFSHGMRRLAARAQSIPGWTQHSVRKKSASAVTVAVGRDGIARRKSWEQQILARMSTREFSGKWSGSFACPVQSLKSNRTGARFEGTFGLPWNAQRRTISLEKYR